MPLGVLLPAPEGVTASFAAGWIVAGGIAKDFIAGPLSATIGSFLVAAAPIIPLLTEHVHNSLKKRGIIADTTSRLT
ncbi:hypothetical protein [Infirmifilum sp.]|uniref:hypothetical protein n=1 Tax=Infirmifilum sp. TaxID=2856575 RepID=UPI003D0AD8C8